MFSGTQASIDAECVSPSFQQTFVRAGVRFYEESRPVPLQLEEEAVGEQSPVRSTTLHKEPVPCPIQDLKMQEQNEHGVSQVFEKVVCATCLTLSTDGPRVHPLLPHVFMRTDPAVYFVSPGLIQGPRLLHPNYSVQHGTPPRHQLSDQILALPLTSPDTVPRGSIFNHKMNTELHPDLVHQLGLADL